MCGEIKFHSKAPMLKYLHESLSSCCFSSLATFFDSIDQTKAGNSIVIRIEESLNSEVVNFIDLANDILKNEKILEVNRKCITA